MKKENQKKRGLFMRQTNLRIWKRRNWGNGKNGREGGRGGGLFMRLAASDAGSTLPRYKDTLTHPFT